MFLSSKNRPLQNPVNLTKRIDPKACASCSKTFNIITRRHCCSKCDQTFCGKCSKVNVITIDNNLTRERSCTKCSLAMEQLKAKLPLGSPFTPSKLHILNESNGALAHSLWSADSESDSENDDSSTLNSVKENLLIPISKENVQDVQQNVESIDKVKSSYSIEKKPFAINFKDEKSGISSILSPISIETSCRKLNKNVSLTKLLKCHTCNEYFSKDIKKHICCQCKKHVCGSCSDSNLTMYEKNLVRQRLCKCCASTTACSLLSPITPKKLKRIDPVSNKQAQEVWSVDTVTDCDSEISYSDENHLLKERLHKSIDQEIQLTNTLNDRPIASYKSMPSILALLVTISIVILHIWYPLSIIYKYENYPALNIPSSNYGIKAHYGFWKDSTDNNLSKDIVLIANSQNYNSNINNYNKRITIHISELFKKLQNVIRMKVSNIKSAWETFLKKLWNHFK